ncbi:MAG: N-acetylmuramoyl-L-alanine amidase [Deinococcaceae bacterium]
MKRYGWLLLALLGAQAQDVSISVFGKTVSMLDLSGSDYVEERDLSSVFQISRIDSPRWGRLIQVEREGKVALLPLERNPEYAAEVAYGVQGGDRRFLARTATVQGNRLFLPLSTLAEVFGVSYVPGPGGKFTQGENQLLNIASDSKRNPKVDRIALEVTRAIEPKVEQVGNELILTLPGVKAQKARYTVSGLYIKDVLVEPLSSQNLGAKAVLSLPKNMGYHVYTVKRGQDASRIVIDVGPQLPKVVDAGERNLYKPTIVLDPGHGGADSGISGTLVEKQVVLEVAEQVRDLLTQAGWTVKMTRNGDDNTSLEGRANLARTADLFLSFHISNSPGRHPGGITLYRPSGLSHLGLIDRVRGEDANVNGYIRSFSDSQAFSKVLSENLSAGGFAVSEEKAPHHFLLQNTAKTALAIELGWLNTSDIGYLKSSSQLKDLSGQIARSVATFLTPSP